MIDKAEIEAEGVYERDGDHHQRRVLGHDPKTEVVLYELVGHPLEGDEVMLATSLEFMHWADRRVDAP